MFIVESDGTLEGGVAEDVAVGKIFGYDAGAGLVFLGDVMAFAGLLFGVRAREIGNAGCTRDGDL